MLLLHSENIDAQLVLSRHLVALRKVVYLLVLVQAFVQIRLAWNAQPQQVPVVRVCVGKPISF